MIPEKADFLRQVFNVILARHQDRLDPRTVTELRKLVWQAENKYRFSSFENSDPTKFLKKYFQSDDIVDVLRLLKDDAVINELLGEVKEAYGEELAELLKTRLEKLREISS